MGSRAFLDIFRRVRKIAKSDYKLRNVCITPAEHIKNDLSISSRSHSHYILYDMPRRQS
jgi:hypothetical protein